MIIWKNSVKKSQDIFLERKIFEIFNLLLLPCNLVQRTIKFTLLLQYFFNLFVQSFPLILGLVQGLVQCLVRRLRFDPFPLDAEKFVFYCRAFLLKLVFVRQQVVAFWLQLSYTVAQLNLG